MFVIFKLLVWVIFVLETISTWKIIENSDTNKNTMEYEEQD